MLMLKYTVEILRRSRRMKGLNYLFWVRIFPFPALVPSLPMFPMKELGGSCRYKTGINHCKSATNILEKTNCFRDREPNVKPVFHKDTQTTLKRLRDLLFAKLKKPGKHQWRVLLLQNVTVLHRCFFTFFKLYKWYQIVQSIIYYLLLHFHVHAEY